MGVRLRVPLVPTDRNPRPMRLVGPKEAATQVVIEADLGNVAQGMVSIEWDHSALQISET